MRIVSLAPGATDLVERLGLSGSVVGGEGDVARAVPLPVPERPLVAGVAPHAHTALFALDRPALRRARPDVLLTTEVCPVCLAMYRPLADGAATAPGTLWHADSSSGEPAPEDHPLTLVSFNPMRLEHALAPILPVATLLGQAERGERLLHSRSARLLALSMHVARHLVRTGGQRRSVTLLAEADWNGATPGATSGLVALGRWFPDLVDAAGGVPLLAVPGEGDVPAGAAGIAAARPDVLIVGAPDLDRAAERALTLQGGAHATWALRLDSLFRNAGPGLVDAVEVLLRMVSPEALGANGTPPPDDRARRVA